MKKITILSLVLIGIVLGLSSLSSELRAQSAKKIIKEANSNFIQWFNEGEMGLLSDLYHEDACLLNKGCGKTFIESYYSKEAENYRFKELTILDIRVNDTVAIEKGRWKIELINGYEMAGNYVTEWRFRNKKWLMFSDFIGELKE